MSAQLILAPERAGTWAEVFGLRWQSAAATALSDANQPGLVLFQSGVALRLPPESKISHFKAAPQDASQVFISLGRFLIIPMIGYG